MILEHYSKKLTVFDRSRVYKQREDEWHKPRGFWVSVKGADDWPSWCEQENFYWPEGLRHRYEVTIREDANILMLGTVAELRAFHKEFKGEFTADSSDEYGVEMAKLRASYIDWHKVASTYDGIIIAPYQWPLRTDSELRWYYSWDVASGCIWNLDVIDIEWKEQDWIERRDASKKEAGTA